MKKFYLMLALFSAVVMSANAQIATENSKVLDNIYVGVEVGATTPLSFKNVFPVNTVAGVKIGKEFTPVVGIEIEGQTFFNDNNVGRWTNTFVKGTNVGLNGTINASNLIWGYKGTPRFFEVKANVGLSWLHYMNAGANDLLAKTGVDFYFNLGKKKAHTISVSPAIYWNLTGGPAKIQFNSSRAQIGLFASYIYHFKTSNGTHHFKTYDVGAMMDEINRLNDELAKKPTEVVVEKIVEKEVIKEVPTATVTSASGEKWIVTFATSSAKLTPEAKFILNQVGENAVVDITATASQSGSAKFNQKLSEKRAKAVADFLTNRGVKVNSAEGKGVDATRGRSAVVTVK